ncbi:tyrosine-type recombinase/integrase [Verrucomicrobium sp. BvORR034]|uniref:tyrosine-type recombinase/integrase n=1 Tax=Verrucomicrobium sp. BvORR034 TaxID=1396418 RepID=UPI00067923DC|nr:tyrosine-type recombinase/integrase [Verrucomicrobium sp. BvORR034]
MASLRKRAKSPYWVACYYDAEGKRTQRSTETTNRSHAMKQAVEWEGAARLAKEKRLTVDKARTILNEMLRLTGQAIDAETLRTFSRRWLDGKARNRAARTAESYEGVVKAFLAVLGPKADHPVSTILPRDVEAFRDKLVDEGLTGSSVNQRLKIVGAMFATAQRQGIIGSNPARSVEVDDTAQESRDPFTADEVQVLLTKLPDDWPTAVALGAFASMRLGDAANLDLARVNLEDGAIVYTPQKTSRKGRVLTVPMHPEVEKRLRPMIENGKSGPACPSLAGRKINGTNGLSGEFLELMEAAGIDPKRRTDVEGRGRRHATKSFHSLRHFFNTALLTAGVDERVRMALSGHTSASVNQRYSHAELKVLKKAVGKIKK